ncbi:MAG: hypothetical protein JNM43_00035 [Planctomycetaceae bacterium]|nr:hypothetical protein [Planctomycetaceae bacterium]
MSESNLVRTSPQSIRDELDHLVRRELLGPFDGPDEEIDDQPTIRYLVGMLAPPGEEIGAEQNDDFTQGAADDGEDGKSEPTEVRSQTLFPSSFGMTFVVDESVTTVSVTATWGRYERTDSVFKIDKKSGNPKKVWKRTHIQEAIPQLNIEARQIPPTVIAAGHSGVFLQGISRLRDGQRIVTLFLVNGQPNPDVNPSEAWIFQCGFSVNSTDGTAIFRKRPTRRVREKMDIDQFQEDEEMAMLFRREVEFAVGHGVAVHADTLPGEPWCATRLSTVVIPTYDVAQQTASEPDDEGFELLSDLVLDMKRLANAAPEELEGMLNSLPKAYDKWIKNEATLVNLPSERLDGYEDAVGRTIERCKLTLARIKAGIALLSVDPKAAKAFKFANMAMYLQRVHSQFAESRRRRTPRTVDEIDANPQNYMWRPFQLAFLLLNLESLTDLHHEHRSHDMHALADLLWFPTGGGKTEAYLGLAAYVMGLRRLQGIIEGRPGDLGLAVLMRYTLRLLTLQQFQRATALICACESIRRDDPSTWGTEPFRIGLWVGNKSTPGTTKHAAEAIRREKDPDYSYGTIGSIGSPAQLTNCPWCGSTITPGEDIEVESNAAGRGRTLMFCSSIGKCLFSRAKSPKEGIPVLVVDEEIYQKLPTMMIATVDKFAQLPWNGRTQMLFGRVDSICPRHGFKTSDIDDADLHPKKKELPAVRTVEHPYLRPPDLIIQDELHLISGPLGSLVGLYETAVDELCSWTVDGKTVRPKIIASTATVKNAKNQVRRLFQRDVTVFPPPGTDVRDNFFSIRRPTTATPGEKHFPGRRYIGICAPGRSIKAALIRVYTAYMSAAQLLYEKYEKDADSWMTLVGYFNSLRELAGMRRLSEDDVQTRLRHMDQHGLAQRKAPLIEELTSRKGSADIPKVLDHLEAVFDPKLEEDRRKAMEEKPKRIPDSRRPIDILLATNMISVGVDVGRLGLMVVGGQPKNTAEYIQATSRVGRNKPGLVCTVFNWARPRDLSHYERFEHYHATFYRQVEAISVTPFAARALDRGLSALFVALIRHAGRLYNGNEEARHVVRTHEYVENAIRVIVDRVTKIEGSVSLGDDVRLALKQRLDEWMTMQGRTPTLGYKGRKDGVTVGLLKSAESGDWETFTCLNSLRDVEASSSLILTEDAT